MARQVKAADGTNAKRTDMWNMDPNEVIVTEDDRGRVPFDPNDSIDQYKVLKMAIDLATRGQIQPIEVRILPLNKRPKVVSGFTRTAAARVIKEGFIVPEGMGSEKYRPGDHVQHENFMLLMKVIDCNEHEGRLRNIAENNIRNETTDLDDAFNQRWLRDSEGKDNQWIANFYGYDSTDRVRRLQQLLGCSEAVRMLVHRKKLPLNGALELLDVPEDQHKAFLEQAMKQNGMYNATALRSVIRDSQVDDPKTTTSIPIVLDHVLADEPETEMAPATDEAPPNRSRPRTRREIVAFLEKEIADEDNHSPIRDFLKSQKKWVDGKISDKAMENALYRLLSAGPDEVE